MCTIYQSAVQRMLPGAAIAVDLFHVVQFAVKTVGDVRRRAVRELYGRRGRAGDPEYGLRHLLEKNLENLSPEQFAKVIETLDAVGPGQHTTRAWIGGLSVTPTYAALGISRLMPRWVSPPSVERSS